ncbi:MAG: NADH-quinone oxidoreductase subunit NuoI [Dissulfurispiraceae bacterium]|nr:NADH-quinone oxidoreductase subunit NuoI [Dissulfurispiraceae bacterium]
MGLKKIIKKVFMLEILKGMALTFRALFKRPVTRQYPRHKREPFGGFRGLHALVRRPDGDAVCVGCGLCAAVCPSKCIKIHTSIGPDHKKVVNRYEVEVLRCLYCALCVEACPYKAVVLTDIYEYSGFTREEFYMTKDKLLANWDRFADSRKKSYFANFWRPLLSDFKSGKDQARLLDVSRAEKHKDIYIEAGK